jgi:hypothetical protein
MTIESNLTNLSNTSLSGSPEVDGVGSLLRDAAASLLNVTTPSHNSYDSEGIIPADAFPVEVLKYGRYYNSFFASGLAALLILVGLFLYVGYKKYQRTNPIGIMFNLVLI